MRLFLRPYHQLTSNHTMSHKRKLGQLLRKVAALLVHSVRPLSYAAQSCLSDGSRRCVGMWQNDRVEIIPNDQGNRTTPSYVAFTDTERLVGDAAKNQASTLVILTVSLSRRIKLNPCFRVALSTTGGLL